MIVLFQKLWLFFLWYHIDSFFFKAGDLCTINKDKNLVESSKDGRRGLTCYGSIVMPSVSEQDVEYRLD